MASLGLHGLSLVINVYYLQRCESFFKVLRAQGGLQDYGGEYRFLTQLTHIMTTIYFAFALMVDLHRVFWRRRSAALATFKELLFSLSMVCASMTVILFWGLYLLISPAAVGYSTIYPDDLNRFQHGFVAVLVWLDLLLCRHEKLRFNWHLAMLLSFMASYIAWMAFTTSKCGRWPYPFLDTLPLAGHMVFYAVTLSFSSFLLFVILKVQALRWPAERQKRD